MIMRTHFSGSEIKQLNFVPRFDRQQWWLQMLIYQHRADDALCIGAVLRLGMTIRLLTNTLEKKKENKPTPKKAP